MPNCNHDTDRGVKVFHAEKSAEKWVAYVLRDIAAFVANVDGFKQGLDEILQKEKCLPSEKYAHAIFAVGQYAPLLQQRIDDYLRLKGIPPNLVERKAGDYFTLHRYTIMSELDSEVPQAH